ncbi:MAG: nuclear transport factor 2 family protein, partial [Deltaproteobacteria bacterium]|nr:nuclear transport factor 2 family protein [Deltaproteobacteria bacterium]
AWTGNQPEKLASFYTEDAFYSDSNVPQGLKGKSQILAYFRKLLAKNPDWVWTQEEALPLEDGFVNKWKAQIPVEGKIIECRGVCLVHFKDNLICRNQVYFDPTPLVRSAKK